VELETGSRTETTDKTIDLREVEEEQPRTPPAPPPRPPRKLSADEQEQIRRDALATLHELAIRPAAAPVKSDSED
jgi:hypothetical protein